MSAKKKTASSRPPVAIRLPVTVVMKLAKPIEHEITLPAGMTLKVVPDGQGAEVNDVSKTIWRSRADALQASFRNNKGVHASAV